MARVVGLGHVVLHSGDDALDGPHLDLRELRHMALEVSE